MGKSLLQTTNQSIQTLPEITEGSTPVTLSLGTAVHGYGCGIKLSGNAIRLQEAGYYKVDAAVSFAPTATGEYTVALYDGNEPIETAYASISTAGNTATVPIVATIRKGCNCDGADSLTIKVVAGVAGAVSNVACRVEKS